MKSEALRRLMHVATAAVLLSVPLGSWDLLRVGLICATVFSLLLDLLRSSNLAVGARICDVIPVYRQSEAGRLSGATWLGVGYSIAAVLPPPAPVAGILVAAVADPAAAVVGSWGRGAGRKSLRGSLAALASAAIVLALLTLPAGAVLAGAFVAALVERWSGPLSDNLTVPPATALVVWLTA